MNLQDYAAKYGTERVHAIALLCGVSIGYMQNLLYTVNSGHKPPKTPSIKLAKKMSHVTFGELSMDELALPTEYKRSEETPRAPHGFRETHQKLDQAA